MNPSLPGSMHEDLDKMKGDAIGDTMYSERWVLKTLMKLSQEYTNYCNPDEYHLESDLEGDLGLLWDMTIEPDVAGFVVENNAVELISDVISFSCSPRLTEIMIGILGNLACREHIRQRIGTNTELMKVIISLLKLSDSPTLIQLIRLIKTCIWVSDDNSTKTCNGSNTEMKESGERECQWTNSLKSESELLYQSLSFILASSRNEDLLCSTLGLIESLFNLSHSEDDYFCKQFSTEDFVKALVESMKEICSHSEDGTDGVMINRKLKEACVHWVSILYRLACHREGMKAIEKQADTVFNSVNAIWVEQSARCFHLTKNHTIHLMLALKLLGRLLPMQSHLFEIHHVLALLSRVNQSFAKEDFEEEEDRVSKGDLKGALEDFCFRIQKSWKQKYETLPAHLKCYSEDEIDLLVNVLVEKLAKMATSSAAPSDMKQLGLKALILNIPNDLEHH